MTPTHLRSAASTSGLNTICAEVRRADLLLALAHQHEVDRQLLARRLERVQRGETRDLRSLLVGRAAADDHLADARLVDEPRLERRRAPLRGIELLDVVHEVEAERGRARRRRASRTRRACRRSARARRAGSRRRARASPCTRRPADSCGSRPRSTAARSSPAASSPWRRAARRSGRPPRPGRGWRRATTHSGHHCASNPPGLRCARAVKAWG